MSEVVETEQEETPTTEEETSVKDLEDMRSRAQSQTVTMYVEPDVSKNLSSGLMGVFFRRNKSIKPISWIVLIVLIVAVYMLVVRKQQPDIDSLANSSKHGAGKAHHGRPGNKHHPPVENVQNKPHVPDQEEIAEAQGAADEIKQYAEFKDKHGVDAVPPLKPHGKGKQKTKNIHGAPKPKEFPVEILLKPKLLECTEEKDPWVIILVDTQPGHVDYRNAIRKSWGSPENHKRENRDPLEWQVIFIVGTSDEHNEELKEENLKHNDILQGDFRDTPYEETRKCMMSFKWLTTNTGDCIPSYVMKSPDDIFVNFDAIQEWMDKNFPDQKDLYMGRILRRDAPERRENDPMYVSEKDYMFNTFPDLVIGPVYMLSYEVVKDMTKYFDKVTPIAQADAYIGIIAKKLSIDPVENSKFLTLYKPSFKCFLIGLFFVQCTTPQEHEDIFRMIHKARFSMDCAPVHGLKIPKAHKDVLRLSKKQSNGL